MNKNTIYTIFGAGFAIIFLVIIILVANPKNGNANKTTNKSSAVSVISAGEKIFDFGSVSMANGKVSHLFKIKNSSDKPVNVEKLYTSCMCTSVFFILGNEKNGGKIGPFGMAGHGFIPKINKTLAVGGEAEIEAIFDPTAHGPAGVGQIKRDVYLEDSNGGILDLQFYANVTP